MPQHMVAITAGDDTASQAQQERWQLLLATACSLTSRAGSARPRASTAAPASSSSFSRRFSLEAQQQQQQQQQQQ
jgi:hypothetical protein